jgi:metal-dependent hydrolase (beta-lactamase superfamily II)
MADQYPAVVPLPYRPFLVDADGNLMLLDTGAGPLAPSTGPLQVNLQRLGVMPEMIDLVVLACTCRSHRRPH